MSALIVIVVVDTEGGPKGSTAGSAAARLECRLNMVGYQGNGPRPLSTWLSHGLRGRMYAKPLVALAQMGILWQAQPRHPLLLPYYSPVHRPCFLPFRPSSLNLLNQSLLLVHVIERDSLANVIRLSRHRPPLTYCISGTLSVRLATYQSSHPPLPCCFEHPILICSTHTTPRFN